MSVPPIMLSGLDLIIIQARLHVNGKTARKITEVAEIAGMEGDKPRLNAIWKYNASTDQIEETGIPSKLRETICNAAGVTLTSSNATSHSVRPSLRIFVSEVSPTFKPSRL